MAGQEVGVASTSGPAQLAVLLILTIALGRRTSLTRRKEATWSGA